MYMITLSLLMFLMMILYLCQEQLFYTGKGEKNDSTGALETLEGKGHNLGSSSSSLVMSKYTYFRKKRLARKKLGSLSQCTVSELAGVLKQAVDRLRDKEMSGIMSKLIEVGSVFSVHVPESDTVKFKAETENRAALAGIIQSLPDDCASTKKISRHILQKCNSVNQSKILLLTLCSIGFPFSKIMILHNHESCICRF